METDYEILNWLERNHTLHNKVEALYVVDGYLVTITHNSEPIPNQEYHGTSLRDAYTKAMMGWDLRPLNDSLPA